MFDGIGDVRNRHAYVPADIVAAAQDFEPDAVLVSGWQDAGYVKVCKVLKASGVPIVAGCDTQWTGSLRQRIAGIVAPLYLHKFIDVLWVTGERQRQLANKLGYYGDCCWDGYYSCDFDCFSKDGSRVDTGEPPFGFLYVGRYVPEKGLDTLAAAYKSYCRQVSDPWPLVCAGSGGLRELLVESGADDRGFVQPHELPALLAECACFILPSRFEPWGVVAHEAAAAGLALILSDKCGSGVHLLRPNLNGFEFHAGSAKELAEKMLLMHRLSQSEILDMKKASYNLSSQYTPRRWASILIDGLPKRDK
ncbi:MAG: glycosyltransferase [Pseudomonadales bacterium]